MTTPYTWKKFWHVKELQKAVEESAEKLEDLRSIIQLGLHEAQQCGHKPEESHFMGPAGKAMRQETLEMNPYWGRLFHAKETTILQKNEQIDRLKEEVAELKARIASLGG